MKNNKINLGVSEIVGAILLLGIAVTVFSIISYTILSTPTPVNGPIVEISGTTFDNQIVLTHKGGESLDLNIEIFLKFKDYNRSLIIGDYLDDESKSNGLWDLGEKLYYPAYDEEGYITSPNIDIMMADVNSNSLVFIGEVNVVPVCDLRIDVSVNNSYPIEGELITFTIKVTNLCNINTNGIIVEFKLPEGLIYFDHSTTQGFYNNDTCLWNIVEIKTKQSENLYVQAIAEYLKHEPAPTQLILILDGSGSIRPEEWKIITEGISSALNYGINVPHDGTAELTIVQFGGNVNNKWDGARVEIYPTIINEYNLETFLTNNIENMNHIGDIQDHTPASCGIYLAADTLKKFSFRPDIRQVFLFITDGNPNSACICCDDINSCIFCDDDYLASAIGEPKEEMERAVDYLVKHLNLNIEEDEFDAITVNSSIGQISHLQKVVWPPQNLSMKPYIVPPFDPTRREGWIREAKSWEDFVVALNHTLGYIFNSAQVKATIKSVVITDPIITNNENGKKITIIPKIE